MRNCARRRISRHELVSHFPTEEVVNRATDRLDGVLSRGLDVGGEFAADLDGEAASAAGGDEGALDHGVELLDAEDLVEAVEEVGREGLREGVWGRHAEHPHVVLLAQVLGDVGGADAVGCDAEARAGTQTGRLADGVSRVAGEALGEGGVALLDRRVGAHGERGEDDPAGGVADEALGLAVSPVARVSHLHVLVAVVDSRGRAHDHGAAELLGEVEGLPHHRVGLGRARRVQDRQLGVGREGARVLLGLGRDGTRVVRHEHDHTTLDADVGEAHERVGGDVEAHLLHRDERAGSRVGGPGGHLERRLLVDRPLHVDALGASTGDGLQHLGRRRARVARHDAHARGERPHRNGLVAHQELSVHGAPSHVRPHSTRGPAQLGGTVANR